MSLPRRTPGQARADIGIIGVGSIAEAIVVGLCTADDRVPTVSLSPRSRSRSGQLAARFTCVEVAADNQAVVDGSDRVLLAVRPQHVEDVLSSLTFAPDQPLISLIAGVGIRELQQLVAPARVVARAVPLPSVADRRGLTAIWPAEAGAIALFERLGATLTVDRETTLADLSTASGTIAASTAYFASVQRWLVARGVNTIDASHYVGALFAPILGLLDDPPEDLAELTRSHTTPGGLNERFLASLHRRGVFDSVEQALDELSASIEPTD